MLAGYIISVLLNRIIAGLDPQEVWKALKKESLIPDNLSSRLFNEYWKSHHWNVLIKAWQPFAKCDECLEYRQVLMSYKPSPIKDELRLQQHAHRDNITIARRRGNIREKLAELHPDLFLAGAIDAMDNNKTSVPHTAEFTRTKTTAESGEPMQMRLMGKCDTAFVHPWPPGDNKVPVTTLGVRAW